MHSLFERVFRLRPGNEGAQRKDIPTCVQHIAAHPVLGPRYGNVIELLPEAIRVALANEVTWFRIFEELCGPAKRWLGAIMCVFISDEFLNELKTFPMFWVGPEVVKRIANGRSPLLSEVNVRDANSLAGLNLLLWHNTCHPQDVLRSDIVTMLFPAFDQDCRGFRLRELVGQADCIEHYYGMRDGGGFYFDRRQGSYVKYPELNAANFSEEPRTCGLTRDLAFTQVTSWLASIFISYTPPRLALSSGEQRLLRAALSGVTDEELSDILGISIHAVKIKWRVIYNRARMCVPDLISDGLGVDEEPQGRGKEKKQRLLDYMRKHPEELHPVSRKLLLQESAQQTLSRSVTS